jgi:hypothetical protein
MKFTTSAVVAASLAASSTFASFLPTGTLTASGIAGTGAYQLTGNTWTITFTFGGDVNASSMSSDFGSWTLKLLGTNGQTWTTSGSEASEGEWVRNGAERMLTITLAEGVGIGVGDVAPGPTYISISYSARKSGSSWESLGSALLYSGSSTTSPSSRGDLMVRSGISNMISGTFETVIPAPGAVALVVLAGLIGSRRRAGTKARNAHENTREGKQCFVTL